MVCVAPPSWYLSRALGIQSGDGLMKPAILLLAILALDPMLVVPAARAQEEGPVWGSIAASRAHLRAGPGRRFPIEWVYTAPNLPVRITDRYDNWREVTTPSGESGWMHHSLLSARRTALVRQNTTLRRRATEDSPARAEVMAGAVVDLLDACAPDWCRVTAGEWKGYIARSALWGPTDPE